MKFCILLALVISTSVFAGETVISERTVNLPVNLTHARVVTEGTSFPVSQLTLFIPKLADVTILNHRFEGDEAPTLFANEHATVDQIRQGNPDTILLPVKITLIKHTGLIRNKICKVTLQEHIEGTINGVRFVNSATGPLADRNADDCR